jgi:hypothetical protein
MGDTSNRRAGWIAALLEERRGYEAHGKTDRVRQVDEALRAAGYEEPSVPKVAGRRTAAPKDVE